MPEGVRQQLETLAPHLPFAPRLVLANLWLFKPLVVAFGARSPEFAASFRTTIAETMFNAGFKENVLPTEASAVINFRILPGETTDTVAERIRKTVNDTGVTIANNNAAGTRNPSPISPTTSRGYQTLATTIRQLFPGAIVCPLLMPGATDSSYYSVLSPNVYRFLAVEGDATILTMMHGANEHIATDSYIKAVAFYAQLIRNIQ
jgi:carboxypeptidase PM20D1